jgi:hypothetical protein
MYLRFIRPQKIKHMAARAGFLNAAYELRRGTTIDTHTFTQVENHLAWFGTNLTEPAKFTRSKSKGWYRNDATQGLSWFKDSATEMLAHAHDLAAMLNANGYAIEVIRSDRIGYIIYEDAHQVVAEPFADTPT